MRIFPFCLPRLKLVEKGSRLDAKDGEPSVVVQIELALFMFSRLPFSRKNSLL